MRLLPSVLLAGIVSGVGSAQTLAPAPSALQHVTVAATTSAPVVAKGGTVTLWADISPKRDIHVYASDKGGFTPVKLVPTPRPDVKAGAVRYPVPDMTTEVGATAPIPVYGKPFRLALPITIAASARAGETITIAAAVNYEACDDRVCYPATSIPVLWTVKVK
jgi:DsbC/DsbD-like thiol-disulfide interchange protein